MKILITYGSRAEFLKLIPVIKEAEGQLDFKTLWVGQHTDICDFGQPDFFLSIDKIEGLDRNSNLASEISKKSPEIIKDFDAVMIVGDTTTVLEIALAAKRLKKKICFVESGLRSNNQLSPWPEEWNRIVVSHIADYHFCPTELSVENLRKENITSQVWDVGNTVLDNLREIKGKTFYGNKVLVTIHRGENVPIIDKIFAELDKVALSYPELEFVLPVHPNPIIKAAAENLKWVTTCGPLEHKDLIELMLQSKFIISDSAGICEEGSYLNRRAVVVREFTERPEGIESGHFIMCPNINELDKKVKEVYDNYTIRAQCPFGDGHAAKRIVEILKNA